MTKDVKQYEVVRPWFGVEKGDIVTSVGPMFLSNVRELSAKVDQIGGDSTEKIAELEKSLKKAEGDLKKSEKAVEAKDKVISELQAKVKELEAK